MGPFRCIADLRADLLESPLWDDRRSVLFVCDIPGSAIIAIDLAGADQAAGHLTAGHRARPL